MLLAAFPPARTKGSIFLGLRLKPTTEWPSLSSRIAIGLPMIPIPIKATFIFDERLESASIPLLTVMVHAFTPRTNSGRP